MYFTNLKTIISIKTVKWSFTSVLSTLTAFLTVEAEQKDEQSIHSVKNEKSSWLYIFEKKSSLDVYQ